MPGFRPASPRELLRLAGLCALVTVAAIANYVLFWVMGQRMKPWPQFLNYAQSIISALAFVAWLMYRDHRLRRLMSSKPHEADVLRRELERPRAEKQRLRRHYLLLAVLMAANGVAAQTADPHVSGALQSFISILVVPVTGVLAWRFLGESFSRTRIAGACLTVAGVSLAVVPPLIAEFSSNGDAQSGMNHSGWVLLFLGSIAPLAGQSIVEETMFGRPLRADPLRALTWATVWSIPMYIVYIPIEALLKGTSLSVMWQQQTDAVMCFAGAEVADCLPGAGWTVVVFSLEFVLYYYLMAVVVEQESAMFQVIIVTIATPASAVAFSMQWLMGSWVVPLDYWNLAALGVIPLGVVVYKYDDICGVHRQRSTDGLLDGAPSSQRPVDGDAGGHRGGPPDLDAATAALIAASRPDHGVRDHGRVPSSNYVVLEDARVIARLKAAAQGHDDETEESEE